jgi:hypothetical protein
MMMGSRVRIPAPMMRARRRVKRVPARARVMKRRRMRRGRVALARRRLGRSRRTRSRLRVRGRAGRDGVGEICLVFPALNLIPMAIWDWRFVFIDLYDYRDSEITRRCSRKFGDKAPMRYI